MLLLTFLFRPSNYCNFPTASHRVLSVCLSLDVSLSLIINDLQLNFTSTIIIVEPMVAFYCIVDIDIEIVPFFPCSLVVVDVVNLELFYFFILFLSAFFYSL